MLLIYALYEGGVRRAEEAWMRGGKGVFGHGMPEKKQYLRIYLV